jgi:NADH:ubiquinone oxidoreductase subunit E
MSQADPEEAVLSEQAKVKILKIRDEYPDPQSALLPALYLAQRDYGGWLPEGAIDEVAEVMDLPATLVLSVATFYTMFNKKPVGRHLIQVCNYICRKLGIQPGETTADNQFTLLEVECLGSCSTGPMMQVDDKYYGNLTEQEIDRILEELAAAG